MSYKDKYKRYNDVTGNSIREKREYNTRNKLISDFTNSLTYENVLVYRDNSDIKKSLPCQIVKNGKDPTIKKIIFEPNYKFNSGDIIHRNNDELWISLNKDADIIYESGDIQKSNTNLKWVDDNGNIQSFPAIMDSGDASNTAIDVDTIMRIPSGRRQIRTVNNSHTIKIKKDMRFIFGDESFSVADKDPVADVGLITFSFESSEFSQNDNLEIGIADYYNRINPTTIKVIDQNIELKVGQNYPLSIQVFDKNGKVNNPNLMLEYNNSHLLIDKDNNIIPLINSQGTIKILSNSTELIVNYIISDRETMDYNIVIEGKDNIVTGKIVEYYVKFYNNGQLVDYNSKFRLTDVNDKETKLATIVSQDKEKCTIQVSKQVGEVLLHVESLNGLFKSSKLIKIKGLF